MKKPTKRALAITQAERHLEYCLLEASRARAALDQARAEAKPSDWQPKEHAQPTHTIHFTQHQLHIYRDALEHYARWNFGQIEHLMDSLEWSRRCLDAGMQNVQEELWHLKRLLFPEFRRYESNGIGWMMPDEKNATERNAGQVAYEMYREVLVHQARVHHDADPTWTGNVYSGSTLHYSDQALPAVYSLDRRKEVQDFREFLDELAKKYPVEKDASF
jgi:hypothetical protein